MNDALAFVEHLGRPVGLLDVGSRHGVSERWLDLRDKLSILGFEPDPVECARLNAQWAGPGQAQFLPVALGAESTTRPLYLTELAGCASLFPPIERLCDEYPLLACNRPTGVADVSIERLDDVVRREAFGPVDVVKLDVQGAELDVLQGGRATVASARALNVEVAFEPMYEGQALFPEIHTFLRDLGFKLWRFDTLVHHHRREDQSAPGIATVFSDGAEHGVTYPGGQLFWAEASYVHERTFDPPSWQEALLDAASLAAAGVGDRAVTSFTRANDLAPRAVRAKLVPSPPLTAARLARRAGGRALRAVGLRR